MANNNGPLDKFRVKQPSGQRIIKAGFNPGRNASWDWNELLTTIEANFELDFDVDGLKDDVATNTTNISSNDTDIATNATAIATKATTASVTALSGQVDTLTTQVSANLEKIAAICACLTAAGVECQACER
tara:strand:- start:41309 stop:41701 length:393 start_codon:yes stop_codon:yes gene_type:complete